MKHGPGHLMRPHRILIVDDEADNRALLEIVLARDGFVVVSAANGSEALLSLGHHLPDLMLLDLMMPDMSGYQVAAAVRANLATCHLPILMITALTDSATRVRALQAGADEVLGKPIPRAELCLRVRHHLLHRTLAAPPSMPAAVPLKMG